MGARSAALLGLSLGLLGACSGGVTRSATQIVEPSAGGEPEPTISGVIAGQPWRARSALAHIGITPSPERYVLLYPFEWSCEEARTQQSPPDRHFASVFIVWRDGFSASPPDGTFDEERMARGGSVTLLHAARTHGGHGRMRLEMQGDDPALDRLEGEIDVVDCAP